MRRTYITPQATTLELNTHSILLSSPGQESPKSNISVGNKYDATGAKDCYSQGMERAWDDKLDWKL